METYAPKGNIYGPILPEFVLKMSLTSGAKLLYALLCNYSSDKDRCWPSHATLADRLSCSVSSIKNYLAELVRAKLIAVRREQYRSPVYYMLRPTSSQWMGCDRLQVKPAPVELKVAAEQPNLGYLNNFKKQKEENPPLPPIAPESPKSCSASEAPAAGGVSVFLPDFESAWALYPKKEAKGFARMAWIKLQKSGQLPPLPEILAAIRRFEATETWQREQGRFVPQMGNWLRGQRWLDPLTQEEAAERQRREGFNRAFQAQKEREQELREQQTAAKEQMRPLFEGFAAQFKESLNERMYAMAFGTWMYLRSKSLAPLARDVPPDNTLSIMEFMKAFQRRREEMRHLSQKHAPQSARVATFVPCGEALRQSPIFSRFSQNNGQLRRAV